MRARKLSAALAAAALVAFSLTACGQRTERASSQQPLKTFVGTVQGNPRGYIGVITDGERVSGFVTDGVRFAKWFATAEVDDGEAPLVARDGFTLGEVTISDQEASGEIIVGLNRSPFEAEVASGNAGLFTAAERNGRNSFEAGWVVLPDGSELGTYDTYIDEQFTTRPGPRLKPLVKIPGFGTASPHQQPTLFLDLNTQAP